MKLSLENSHLSGSVLRKPCTELGILAALTRCSREANDQVWWKQLLTYVLSCLTKLEKLLCLKDRGSKSLENSAGFHTMKLQHFSRESAYNYIQAKT